MKWATPNHCIEKFIKIIKENNGNLVKINQKGMNVIFTQICTLKDALILILNSVT